MLQQQLQQRDEDLAARKAEISDLKERVAELEKLKQDQTQLLTMKDSELAAAQQRLADARIAANAMAAKPPVQAATANTETSQPAGQPPHASNFMPWLWGGLAFVGLVLLGWLFSRRRTSPAVPPARRSFDSEALAASLRTPTVAVPAASEPAKADAIVEVEDVAPTSPVMGEFEHVIDVTELPSTAAAHVEAPTWHSGRSLKAGPEADPVVPAAITPSFVVPAELAAESAPAPASAVQRMKLARAFLDIGDDHSARQLLVEIKDGAADPLLRTEASKLLRDIG